MRLFLYFLIAVKTMVFFSLPLQAIPQETFQSVVSVLPQWPGRPQGGSGRPAGVAPEGSGVVVAHEIGTSGQGESALIATAWHVVKPAQRIDVRLVDGRILPASLIGHDVASDIAVLRVQEALPAIQFAPDPQLAQPVCTISNAYGLGLSVTCGVVSAVHVSAAGFNAVEDFVQTDAPANPGSSGGALVDQKGRFVGLVSAIFAAKNTDTNIGINFAVSAQLLQRVVGDLRKNSSVTYVRAGWRLTRLSRAELAKKAGARVMALSDNSPAAIAGVQLGDVVLQIGTRRIQKPRDAIAALALVPSNGSVDIIVVRDGRERQIKLSFAGTDTSVSTKKDISVNKEEVSAHTVSDCAHPEAVCAVRQAVFPLEAFDPLGSAVRIGPKLLVTNRHVVGNRTGVKIFTPFGPRQGRVIASAYRGDLALLEVDGLPESGLILKPSRNKSAETAKGPLFVIGADVQQKQIRVFKPGDLILSPAQEATLGRLHVSSVMQPGVSGGALVDKTGRLVGIAVGGGEGHNEALPVGDVRKLLALRNASSATDVQAKLGNSLVRCAAALDAANPISRGRRPGKDLTDAVVKYCEASENHGQYLKAGRLLGRAGLFDKAISFHQTAFEQVPHSINGRISLMVSLQLAGRFKRLLPHARWLFQVAPKNSKALRFAIQAGVWGGAPDLAEAGYKQLLDVNPNQAQAARRFIDNPPPTPRAR